MGAELSLGIVIVGPVVFSLVTLCWAPEEWLHGFVILARSLGRPI